MTERASTKRESCIDKHPIKKTIGIIALSSSLYWFAVLGENKKAGHYLPIEKTSGSTFLMDTPKGSEFIVPRNEVADFFCGKLVLPLQRDRVFQPLITPLAAENTVHVICQGADKDTPAKDPVKGTEYKIGPIPPAQTRDYKPRKVSTSINN